MVALCTVRCYSRISKLDLVTTIYLLVGNRDRLTHQFDRPEAKKDAFAEIVKVMVAVGNAFEYLDAVVQSFGRAVGFFELPGVVDLQAPTVDALSQFSDLGYG